MVIPKPYRDDVRAAQFDVGALRENLSDAWSLGKEWRGSRFVWVASGVCSYGNFDFYGTDLEVIINSVQYAEQHNR